MYLIKPKPRAIGTGGVHNFLFYSLLPLYTMGGPFASQILPATQTLYSWKAMASAKILFTITRF